MTKVRAEAHNLLDGNQAATLDSAIAKIANQQANFEVILENMAQGVVLFDNEHKLLFYNRRYLNLYGIDQHAVDLGMRFHELLELHARARCYPAETALDQIKQSLVRIAYRRDSNHLYHMRNHGVISVHHIPFAEGGWLECHDDITELHRLRRDIEHMAFHDQLTGLPNRNLLMAHFEQLRSSENQNVGILYMDLDGFKKANDEHGHLTGDQLLVMFAERLRDTIRADDLPARIGGDEFIVMFQFTDPMGEAKQLSNRILEAMKMPFIIDGVAHMIGTSIGASFSHASEEPDFVTLIKTADMAMFDAKKSGGAQLRFPQPQSCADDECASA